MDEQEMNVIVDKSRDAQKTQQSSKWNKMKTRFHFTATRGAIGAAVVVLGAAAVLFLWVRAGSRLDPSDYIRIEYTGVNGYARADCVVDTEKLNQALAGKVKDMEKRAACRQLAASLQGTVEASDIKNGDRLAVKVTYDAQAARTAGFKVTKDTYKIKASGIGRGTEIDLFEQVEVVFAGISPEAYIVIRNQWTDPYLGGLVFRADRQSSIAVKDTVTVTCSADETELLRHGYVVKTVSASYTADRLSSYVSGSAQIDRALLGQISKEASQTIETQTADQTFRMLYRATGNPDYLRAVNEEKAEDVKLLGSYFLSRKNPTEGTADNYIYLIFSAVLSNPDASEVVYFAFEYAQGYMTVDGQFDIAHDHQETRYTCKTDEEALYAAVIGEKESLYRVEQMD